jgi:hypothetical protein
MNGLDTEVALAAGYALFLVAAAGALDLLARHSHRRSERFRSAGFRYHPDLDAWECPEREHLWPHEHDHELRLVRYRARPQVCNACPAKPGCTDSDDGREIIRSLDVWPRSEAGRFHRVLSLMLVLLAALLVSIELVRHRDPLELLLLGIVLLAVLVAGQRLTRVLITAPPVFGTPPATPGRAQSDRI